ncbi:MAG: PAS domain S-box protein [Smithellaceae bacterium]
MAKKKHITGIITWLVAIVTGMVVIILPLAFFFHSYQNISAMLETEAEINADSVTHIIGANPDYWEFEEVRLAEHLRHRPKGGIAELRRIVNKNNKIVSESADELHPPLIMRSAAIMDSGNMTGRVEIYRSLRPLMTQTCIIFLSILPIGLGIFFILRILPIRSLFLAESALAKTNKDLETANKLLHQKVLECRRFEEELCKLNEELEARVAERTLQLSNEIDERKQAEISLLKSERKYRFLTDKMSDVVWMTDMNLRTVYVSPSIKAALGFTPEERMAQDIREQVTPATLARVLDIMSKEYELEQQGQADPERTVTYEVEYYHKDGSIRLCENIASGVRDERGVAIGFHGVSRDITERKQAEKALRESEKKYRELVNYLPLSLFEMDMAGNITAGNPAVLETFGYRQFDLAKGLNAFQLIIPADLDRLRANIQKLILWERKDPSEYTGIRKDGSIFPFMIFSSVIIREGKPVGMRGSIIDLTKQKQAETSLRESEKKYRELVDFLPISIYEMDLQGNIISGNPEIFKTFGYLQDDLHNGLNAFQMLITPQDLDRAREVAQRIMSGEKTGGTEYTGIKKDGSKFPFLNIASPIISENKPMGLRGAIIDLTKQKQAEIDLQNARDLLLQSEKLAAIGRLSAGVAHEILNPVNIISMELQILQAMESLPPEVQEELKVCMSQIIRIVTITENLKVFSRVPKTKMVVADINIVIDYILSLHATQLKIEEIETEAHYQPDLPAIVMDREKIEEVILNLISNAMAAMEGKEHKILRIITEKEILPGNPDQLRITIADTGTGIKNEVMSKIFDPFYTTKEPGKGTGLGLSISYGIIHDHGGIIWAENNVWGALLFTSDFPLKGI